jgi:hypothetical protein
MDELHSSSENDVYDKYGEFQLPYSKYVMHFILKTTIICKRN